ncbi:exopolysaccharide biosynthesis polyprenyl glycosylphosphotransferase [Streptomyces olivaceus]|uniref:exopolysaccharide biosynthesis polyprenyl glycosylphosphotransferase n=1 Tax=Streptomyces olivaceus TaxID=47716 RepID=UPI001CCAC9DC|nr:exopolysaccharide biosynthesis polyprenyl glycosylphosphotransferase [Streptomyces olivaceus]MBZ6112513.1 exopolysaccharide biosynthesis polyprenyl glycosylphosphotransferase [Streptomyces olivaceus]MBZ6126038.1 exopolysaccharide biosynthesis polyprenyl glycosylphosphotransferase [Streptomyces olivaceus]MBZ6147140.1 exopolysaccharide biosynthesis polyprenyl glycosylphosphotransferase [Streptomyces olivaceus]MBZ6160890.1 exopolysaccharide biosynthesis polyprenyl glycosylphosphotransferase [St
MTAESTVPTPAGRPRGLGPSPVSVLPQRAGAAGGGPRLPARRTAARPDSPLPLLVADGTAALPGSLMLTGAPHQPLLTALLVGTSLLLRPKPHPAAARPVSGVLDELPALCARIAVVWLALAALLAAYAPAHALSARTLLAGFLLHAATGCAGRGAVHRRRRRALSNRPRAALVVGPAATAQRVASALLRHPGCGVRPVGVVTDDPDGTTGLPVLSTGEEARRAVVQNGVRDVLAVAPAARPRQAALLRTLAESGCTVWEVDADAHAHAGAPPPHAPAQHTQHTPHAPHRIAGFSCRPLEPASRRPGGAGKRMLDVTVSGVLLLLLSPLLLACAAVLRGVGGPGVLFRQERVGRDGGTFTLLKFRTHRPADERESATRWSVADDRRMPWFCRFLRRTSLDELLQLWNVFRGDMSLVGPRPERPYFVARFSQAYPGYAARHRAPGGITGLAQINGLRGDTSIEDRARFDNAYIDDWSLWQDVCILLRTAAALVRPTGS